jgi:5-(carboxyamino)imidazole ribonucleotide synthase
VLEKRVALARELSVVLARDAEGQLAVYAVAENRHVDGVLDVSVVPAQVPPRTALQAREAATAVAEALDYCGVMCLELFELEDGRLLANEVAPRPHNSGHWTLDAAAHSQFEQQVRVLAGLPLADTVQRAPAVMVNLLGDLWCDGEPDWSCILGDPYTRLWLYGKAEARRGRKMGHFTSVDADIALALQRVARLRRALAGAGTVSAQSRLDVQAQRSALPCS